VPCGLTLSVAVLNFNENDTICPSWDDTLGLSQKRSNESTNQTASASGTKRGNQHLMTNAYMGLCLMTILPRTKSTPLYAWHLKPKMTLPGSCVLHMHPSMLINCAFNRTRSQSKPVALHHLWHLNHCWLSSHSCNFYITIATFISPPMNYPS